MRCTMVKQNGQQEKRRGSTVVEMAVMLPVLILLFVGMVEFGQFILMRERINKVTNQLTGVLYNMKIQDVSDDAVLSTVMDQAKIIASPLPEPTVTVRFCKWKDGRLCRINRQTRAGVSTVACGDEGPKCSVEATQSGYGSFVQVYACSTFRPLLTGGAFSIFKQQIPIKSLSYLPLSDANIEPGIEALPGGDECVPESANCATDPSLCPSDADNPCKANPSTELVNGACKPLCDNGYRRDADGNCPCPPGKTPDGNGSCSLDACEDACQYRSHISPFQCLPKPNC